MKTIRLRWEMLVSGFVLISLAVSAVYVTVMFIVSPSKSPTFAARNKSDYILMLVQCIMGIIAMLLPRLFQYKINIIIPSGMLILFALFLYGGIYLGEVRSFFYTIPYWDNILHFFSGGMLSILGFSFVVLLNKTDRIPVNLSAEFVYVFTFCFAVALGVLWEVYEFSLDGLLGLNMQKFALESGVKLSGRAALSDTMLDLIIDCISAFAISTIGYISLKRQKRWMDKLLLKKRKNRQY